MDIHFSKSELRKEATVSLPSSKSLSHRALIAASLAQGDSFIKGITESKDTKATMSVLEHLGVLFERNDEGILVHGCGGAIQYDGEVLDCNESGSTLRFLIPLASNIGKVSFTGHGRLMERPQSVYEEIYHERNLELKIENDILQVEGPLPSDKYIVRGNVSSQFISGLLFVLPILKEDSDIEILPPFESASYIDLTIDTLKHAGITIEKEGLHIHIPGNQTYIATTWNVEGDDSQMAFFAELACVQHKPVTVLNINHDSHQGDHVIVDIIKKMGGNVKEVEGGYCFSADKLEGTKIDLADCPDLGPALFCLATQCEGVTTFINCERLRIKESDRIAVMEEELRKLGCEISSAKGTVLIKGPTKINSNVTLDGHNDHRVVMSLSMLATLSEGVTITGCEAVEKSYPAFFEDMKKLGVKYD